jgi:putative endonuclease
MQSTPTYQQKAGKQAETQACSFLEQNGLKLLCKNYQCYHGEIDLIMQDKDHIVFVEVRIRHRDDYGSALESINNRKIQKLIKAATQFLQWKKWLYRVSSRFDVVTLQWVNDSIKLDWIKNAFTVDRY